MQSKTVDRHNLAPRRMPSALGRKSGRHVACVGLERQDLRFSSVQGGADEGSSSSSTGWACGAELAAGKGKNCVRCVGSA